jgi:hypothetical protein
VREKIPIGVSLTRKASLMCNFPKIKKLWGKGEGGLLLALWFSS